MGKKLMKTPKPKEHAFRDVPDLLYDMEKHVGTSAPLQTKDTNSGKACPGVIKSLPVS